MKIRLQNQSSIKKTTEVKCRDSMERTRKKVYGMCNSSRLNHHRLNDTDLRDVFPGRKGISLPMGLIFQNVDDCGYSTFAAGWSTNKPIAARRHTLLCMSKNVLF